MRITMLRYLIVFTAITFGSAVDSSEFLHAQPHAEPYFVKENDTDVILPCSFAPKYAQAPYRVNWVLSDVGQQVQILTAEGANFKPDLYELDSSSCNGCYNLRIRSVRYASNNGKFSCQVNGPSVNVISRAAVVIVLVKPGPPIFTAQPLIFHERKSAKLECRSIGGNPPPSFRWFFSNGTEVSALARTVNSTNLSEPTVSALQWNVNAEDDGSRVTCKLWNEALNVGETLEATTEQLKVYYAPRVVTGPALLLNIELGSYASFYCSATSNPPPQKYIWLFNNVPLDNYTPNFTLPLVSKDMTGNYTCQVLNEEGSGRDTISFNVLYAPTISLPLDYRSSVGGSLRLTCSVDSNPQPSSVTWTLPNGRTSDGPTLEMSSISLQDAGNYTCTAKNLLNLYGVGPVYRSATKSTTLIVDHPPGKGIIRVIEPVVVGQMANFTCYADSLGSPPAQFRWKVPGQQDFEHSVRSSYIINDVQLSDTGLYSCLPWNVVGAGDVGTFQLTVYDPARIKNSLNVEDTKNEHDRGYTLNCTAVGYPAPNITWYKDSNLINMDDHWEIYQESIDNHCPSIGRCLFQVMGILKWKDGVKWTDKGDIECGAYNGAGQIAYSRMKLNVFHKPVIVNDPTRPFVAASMGGSAEIRCRASSKPEPSFSWSKGVDGAILIGSTDFYTTSTQTNESFDVYESILYLKRVRDMDMGDYICKAGNNFGTNSFIFTVQAKTKPMIPENLRSPKQTHRWILLSWTPGFNGGNAQMFEVEVVYAEDQSVQTYTVLEDGQVRNKRHAGIETTPLVYLNVTKNITPSMEYKFRIRAKNDFGITDWTPYAKAWSADAPFNLSIQKVTNAFYDADAMTLEFQPKNLETQLYCLMIYQKSNVFGGKYSSYGCVNPAVKADDIPPAANMKVRFCYRYTLECGESFDVLIGAARAAIGWEVIVAVITSLLVLIALLLIGCFCFRRCRSISADKTKKVRPKTISGPFLTEKTPGPSSGLGTLDQHTASSKDSGVFTTASTNYRYDPSPYAEHDPRQFFSNGSATHNGNVVYNHHRPATDRRPSFDDQKNWSHDYGSNYHPTYRNSAGARDFRDGGDVNRGFDGEFFDHGSSASYPADPFDPAVDMNPDPTTTMCGSGETRSSMNKDPIFTSAFSTPSQKRVIREIIV